MNEPQTPRWKIRRIVYYALLTAVAIVLSAAESMLPIPAPAAGVKLGLANIVALVILLDDKNPAPALAVTAIRCALTAFVSGTLSSLIFSFAGGISSCMTMWLLLHFNYTFSTVGASVAGALSHNIAQLAAASAIAHNFAILGYLPILIISGIAAGCAIGFISLRVHKILKTIIK